MLCLRLLCCILCTIYSVYMSRVSDQQCVDNCSCCIDEECGERYEFPNSCLKGCIDGHRGARCYELCQYENCKSCGFQSSNNTCTACYDGYYLGSNKDCRLKCPSNCKSCTSGTMCTECKEGFYDENGSTTCQYVFCPTNCKCYTGQGDCISCKNGFYDTSTSCSKQCPVNCLSCESEASCTNCKSGFYNGYKYDNNINIQLNNCSYACRDTCTQCQSYNNCLQCIKGKFGKACQEDCSVGCKYGSCSLHSGQCACTIGFTGAECLECVNGKYGLYCDQACSKYCRGNICERNSGDCISGCLSENITGNTCNTCRVGMYGESCNIDCSKNCRNKRCEKFGGKCSEGCIGNFNGAMCDLCIHGKYGENCEQDCPIHCAGKVCDKTSGSCYDCIGRFHGKMCEECKSGYYGPNCNETCSQHCANNTCNRTTGKCISGCLKSYSGDKCCVKSNHCLDCINNMECRKCAPGFYSKVCNKSCSEDCLGPCDISTGACSNCEYSRFGRLCELNCSGSCKFEAGNHERACARSDGTCINGCSDGYLGNTCTKTCRSFCAGGVCTQYDGICINGCDSYHEEPECLLSEKQQADEDGAEKTFIILFVLSAIIIILQGLGLFILCKRRRGVVLREASNQQSDVFYENMQMTTAPPLSPVKETSPVSANKTTVYEDMNRAQGTDEDYQAISTIQVRF